MEAEPCRICESKDLRPLWSSETGEKWVACDNCGNTSSPVISNDRDEIIEQWNKEQTAEAKQ